MQVKKPAPINININIKNDIKSKITASGYTLTQIVEILNSKYNYNTTIQNISNKLTRGTIKYIECLHIAEIAGYKINWDKKE